MRKLTPFASMRNLKPREINPLQAIQCYDFLPRALNPGSWGLALALKSPGSKVNTTFRLWAQLPNAKEINDAPELSLL